MSEKKPKANTRLAGHELPHEGQLYTGYGHRAGVAGKAKCSCDMESPTELPNATQRKKAHREHKDHLRAGGDPAVWS